MVLFMEEDEIPDESIIHFLSDTVEERSIHLILVGEQADIKQVSSRFQPDAVYRSFTRPVDNKVFADTVKDYAEKADSGAFRKSILIVDDDPQYLTMVREWLKGTYKVSMVNSGLQAIKWLGKNKVDLILLDHEMPVTSGPQVLEMLRSDSETCNIPVIFLTGKGDKESVMAVVALRPDGYFLKGIQKEELLEKIQEFFILHK
jgi:CheY-like chemotaxis protein